MTKLFLTAKNFLTRKEEGASMVEYGLMLALIAAVCLAAVGLVGTQASAIFQQIQASL
jgi:pilus assembly protein Flp/PilA